MAMFLRTVGQNRWFPYPPEDCDWLLRDVLHADPLGDLKTTSNTLSIWRVDGGKTDEERVVAAYALTRQSLQAVDYIIFNEETLRSLDIDIERSEGKTPDAKINSSWHYDMAKLTASKLVSFARTIIVDQQIEPRRIMRKTIKKLAQDGLKTGQLTQDRISSKDILRKLDI